MQDCGNKPGADVLVSRQLPAFDKMHIGDRFDIRIVQDSTRAGGIDLFGPPEITGGVVTKVENGKLIVTDENRCKWVWQMGKRTAITVYIKDLREIEVLDNASLVCPDTLYLTELFIDHRSSAEQLITLDIPTLTLDHRQGGTFNLHGKGSNFVPTLYETGKLDARFFHASQVFVFHYGINRADVYASAALTCRTENKGDTYYHTLPSGLLKVYGRGPGTLKRGF
jgi:hypothetical protein